MRGEIHLDAVRGLHRPMDASLVDTRAFWGVQQYWAGPTLVHGWDCEDLGGFRVSGVSVAKSSVLAREGGSPCHTTLTAP